jgi:hypothetical protein
MSFKLKPTKKMEDIMITMVDTKHNEMVEKFKEENECILPKLKEECLLETDSIKLSKLKKQMKEIQDGQLRYYLDNGHHLFSYFEEKKGISEKKSTIKLLNQFFKVDALPDTQVMTNHAMHYLKNMDQIITPKVKNIKKD